MSPEDLDGVYYYYYAYDKQNLYLAFDVKDSRFLQPYEGVGIWNGDSIQIAFDPLCNTKKLTRSYLFDDLEIGIALLPDGKTEVVRYTGPDDVLNGLKTSVRKTSNGLYYEIMVPWKNLGVTPESGRKIGFNFVVNDNDGNGLEKYLTLPPGGIAERTGKIPFFFSDLVLR